MKKILASLLLSVCAFSGLAHAGLVDDAVKRGTLRVGMDPTYMPFEMTNKRGEIIGFEVDLLKAMAKAMGVKLELVSTSYDGIIPALLTDKFDMIGSGMTLTQERNLRLNFSEPFIVVGQTLLIRKELADKAARELAVKAGEKLLAELKAGKTPDVAWSAAQQVSRRDPASLGRDVQRAVFSASVSKLPAYAGAAEGDGFTLVRIDRLLPAGALTGAERQQLVGMLAQLQTAADATSYLNGLRAAYPVTLKQMPAE